MKSNTFDKLITSLKNLEQMQISYTLAHHRDEAVMVTVVLPGERWEIEFLVNGSVEVERFISNGEIHGEEVLSELFTRYSDQAHKPDELSQNVELATTGG